MTTKLIYGWMLLVMGLFTFSACEKDTDSNPTLLEPETFLLNTPPYAENNVYDLENSESLRLTCSQPDYGAPMGVTYNVQVAFSETFTEADEEAGIQANYTTLPTTYTSASMDIDALELSLALVELWQNSSEEDFPANQVVPLYFRLRASLTSAPTRGVCTSNVIALPQVKVYEALPPLELPEQYYLIGDMEGCNSWGTWLEMIPVTETPGKFWRIQYFQAGAQMKMNLDPSWQGDEVGYSDGLVPDESAALVGGVSDSGGNICIAREGWYIVVATVKIVGTELGYTLEFFEPNVYLTGVPAGNTWGTDDEALKFTVPATATEPFVSPAAPNGGDLRVYAKIPDTDWWRSEFVPIGGVIEYRANRGELGQIGVATSISAGQVVKLDFIQGTGSVE